MINIQNAKTHLSRLLDEAAGGEDIVIARAGKPIVRLVPFARQKRRRRLGTLAGKVREARDCWQPDPELELLFYGSSEPNTGLHVAEDEG